MSDERDVVQYFDDVAFRFAGKYGDKRAFRHRLRICIETMESCLRHFSGPVSALDVGCGSGLFAVWLAEHGCTVTAVDQSGEMLSLACANALSRNVEANVRFLHSPAPSPALDGTCADIVLCLSVLEYIRDPEAFVNWLAARLRPGGYILLSCANRASPYRLVERIVKRCGLAGRSYLRYQENQFTLAQVTRLLEKCGLRQVDCCYFGMPSFLYRVWGELESRAWSTMFLVVAHKPSHGGV